MRALQLARYNWPLYLGAAAILFVCIILCASASLSPIFRFVAAIVLAGTAWFVAASFLAFYWMFDQSVFTTWRWLLQDFDHPPARWVLMSAGLKETTGELQNIFPDTDGKIVEVYQTESMNAPALNRARRGQTVRPAITAQPDALPLEDQWADAVIVALLAHEIRNRLQRNKFFLEIKRIVSRQGKVVLVEHLRNLPAFFAFGPGAFHFLPYSEWRRLAQETGLRVLGERSITPFIRVFVLVRSD